MTGVNCDAQDQISTPARLLRVPTSSCLATSDCAISKATKAFSSSLQLTRWHAFLSAKVSLWEQVSCWSGLARDQRSDTVIGAKAPPTVLHNLMDSHFRGNDTCALWERACPR